MGEDRLGAPAEPAACSPSVEPLRVSPADAASPASRGRLSPGYDFAITILRYWASCTYEANPSRGWLLAIAKDLEVRKPLLFAGLASCDEPPPGEDAQAAEGRSPAGAVGEAETPEPQPQAPPAVGGDDGLLTALPADVVAQCEAEALSLANLWANGNDGARTSILAALLRRCADFTALRAKVERQKTEHEVEVRTLRDLLEAAYREVDKARVESEKADDEALHHKTVAADLRLKGTRQEVATVYEWKRRAEAAESTLAAEQAKGREKGEALKQFVRMEQSIMIDLRTAHRRGPGASSAMREDDADMVRDLERAFALAKAALTPTAAESTGGAGPDDPRCRPMGVPNCSGEDL